MIVVPTQIDALNLLLKNRLAANRPSEFEQRISRAMREMNEVMRIVAMKKAAIWIPSGFSITTAVVV